MRVVARTRWSLIGLQVFYVVCSPFWLLFAAMLAWKLEAHGTEYWTWPAGLYYLTLAYPAGLIGAAVASWVLFARGRYGAAVWWNLVPLIWVVPILGILLYANLA